MCVYTATNSIYIDMYTYSVYILHNRKMTSRLHKLCELFDINYKPCSIHELLLEGRQSIAIWSHDSMSKLQTQNCRTITYWRCWPSVEYGNEVSGDICRIVPGKHHWLVAAQAPRIEGGRLSLHKAHPRCEVSCQGVPNWLCASLRPAWQWRKLYCATKWTDL